MKYRKENEICDICKKEIEEVTVQHGFAYDWFHCPHCEQKNIRR